MLEENIKKAQDQLNKKLEIGYKKAVAENGTLVINIEDFKKNSWSTVNLVGKGWNHIVLKSTSEVLKQSASIGDVELTTKWIESVFVAALSYSNKVTFEIIGEEINPGNQLYINLLTQRYPEINFIITAKVPMLMRSYDEFETNNQNSLIRTIALFFAKLLFY